jgi:uncharacterized membrane protein
MTQPPRWGLRNEEQAFRNAYCDRRVHHDRGPRMTGNAHPRIAPRPQALAGNRATGRILRRRDRGHHHHHGAGTACAARAHRSRAARPVADVCFLPAEYLFVAIIWVNHHHLVHYTREATPRAVWTNLLMLFFVSLIPFFTEWVADSRLAPFATAMYEADFLTVCGTFILFENSVAAQLDPEDRALAATRARANRRNWFAFALYALAIPAAFWEPVVSLGILLLNGVRCIVPESRMGLMRRKALL